MNKLIISIFTLLLVAVSGFAQTVTGTVTDNYGPVIGAAVMVYYYRYGRKLYTDQCS